MSNNKDSLGDRMKKSYEYITRTFLTRRIPVIIRLDGKAFHTFTRGFDKPFDGVLMRSMQRTMKYMCENVQGCVFGYTQSDEITLVLTDYAKTTTDAWFGYNVQKMASVAASMATLAFDRFFAEEYDDFGNKMVGHCDASSKERKLWDKYREAHKRGAIFDARAFSVPKDEVCNCLIWRQQDAVRNSIEAAGQAHFSARELHKKSTEEIRQMLLGKEINWLEFSTDCKRGSCCYRVQVTEDVQIPDRGTVTVTRDRWVVDHDIPVFSTNRLFVEKWI